MKVAKLFFLMLIPSIAQPHTNIQQDTPFLSLEEAKALVPYHPMDEEENIKISDEFYKNFDAIREHLGDAFGGIWLSFDENGKAYPVIAVTTKEKSLKKEWLIHGAVVVQVPYSVKELTKIQDFITDAIGSNDASDELAVYSSYVNEKKNKVSIRAPLKNKQKIMAKIKEMGIDTSKILFEEESHPITLYANLLRNKQIYFTNPHSG
ncbi:hypothetical protein [Vandammella animalimorsus]|uniref:hypothetical protein n=1 Tax=Vandammella animalimorsus TaxID=2029117 RepID=UPI0011C3C879|nr:hypothetical protein [Vandammella animalimorsus]